MGYPYDYEGTAPSPRKPRVLLAVREAIPAAQLRTEIGNDDFHVVSPDIHTYAADFDILIMAFDPQTENEQRWYHLELVPKLKTNAKIFWSC